MADDNWRLDLAQWVFERNLGWIHAAEVKVGVIVAINTAMLGGLGAALGASTSAMRTEWASIFAVAAAVSLASGIVCAAMVVLPRLNGPETSLLYFGKVGVLQDRFYIDQFKQAPESDLLADCLAQIHRNAQIAIEKYAWVRVAMAWSFLAVLPWATSIMMLLNK